MPTPTKGPSSGATRTGTWSWTSPTPSPCWSTSSPAGRSPAWMPAALQPQRQDHRHGRHPGPEPGSSRAGNPRRPLPSPPTIRRRTSLAAAGNRSPGGWSALWRGRRRSRHDAGRGTGRARRPASGSGADPEGAAQAGDPQPGRVLPGDPAPGSRAMDARSIQEAPLQSQEGHAGLRPGAGAILQSPRNQPEDRPAGSAAGPDLGGLSRGPGGRG